MTPLRRVSLRAGVAKLPLIGPVAKKLSRKAIRQPTKLEFRSTVQYWEDRYAAGGNSGAGSYGRLARFKADVINDFVRENGVATVIEFGCGDGAQLELARYHRYTGIDVSLRAIELCRKRFHGDVGKQFFHSSVPEANTTRVDMALSLDVIYHLVEDDVYETYMARRVAAAKKFTCIYSSNVARPAPAPHIRHRRFTDWLRAQSYARKLVTA